MGKVTMRFYSVMQALSGIVIVSALVAGCGQESDNQNDPTKGATAVCKEAYAEKYCIPGRFIGDAVQNLDYQCGKVKARTNVDGSFVCPITTRATFSMVNPDADADATKTIVLGQLDIRKPALLCIPNPNNDCTNFPSGRLYVTPVTLAGSETAQLNMVRLLLVLNKDPAAAALDSPAHRIVLSQTDKEKLSELPQGISASDFNKAIYVAGGPTPYADTFDKLVEPYLTALGLSVSNLVDSNTAKAVLQRALRSTTAGMYTANSFAGFSALGGAETNMGAAGFYGKGSGFSTAGDAWVVVDRKGRMLGQGIYAKKPDGQTDPMLYTNYPVRPMILQLGGFAVSSVPTIPLWPIDGRLRGLSWALQDVDGNGDPIAPLGGLRTLTLNQGVMEKGAIAGTSATFINLFGDNPDVSTELGQWQLEDSSTGANRVGSICPTGYVTTSDPLQTQPCTAVTSGDSSNYTMLRTGSIAPTLDPQLWGNTTNPLFPVINFPINAQLSFKNKGTGSDEKTFGPIYVSILADGNIVTNLNYNPSAPTTDCNQGIDKDTLMDAAGQQEYPVGVVSNISQTSNDDDMPKQVFFTPFLMVSEQYMSVNKMLPYIQFLSNLNQSFVLRIGANTDTTPKLDAWTVAMEEKNGSSCNNDLGCARFTSGAQWVQTWRSWRALATGETKVKSIDAEGTVISAPAAKCYP